MSGEPIGRPLDLGAAILDVRSRGSRFLVVSAVAVVWIGDDDDEPETDRPPTAERFSAASIAADGPVVAVATVSGDVWLYDSDARSWRPRPRPHPSGAGALAIHPRDGRLLACCLDGPARLYNLHDDDDGDGAPMMEFVDYEETVWGGFSPSGETLATISKSGDVQLWDAASGAALGEPLPHRSSLGEVVFHPEGAMLATGCHDGSARLWDAAAGLPLGPPLSPAGAVCAVESLAFSPDGRRLAASCGDGRLRFWKTPAPLPGAIERIACWVRVATNLDVDSADAVRPLEPLAGWELRRRLYELGGPPLK